MLPESNSEEAEACEDEFAGRFPAIYLDLRAARRAAGGASCSTCSARASPFFVFHLEKRKRPALPPRSGPPRRCPKRPMSNETL